MKIKKPNQRIVAAARLAERALATPTTAPKAARGRVIYEA